MHGQKKTSNYASISCHSINLAIFNWHEWKQNKVILCITSSYGYGSIFSSSNKSRPIYSVNRSASCQSDSCWTSRLIPLLQSNAKAEWRDEDSRSLRRITGQINLIHNLISCSILILSSLWHLCIPSDLVPSAFLTKILYLFLIPPCITHLSRH
jgi:hypothetical protein